MTMPDINNLLESLSSEDISALDDMAQQLFGDTSAEKSTTNPAADIFGGIDPSMLAKIMQVMPMLQSGDNDRTRLINALKPMLSHRRRKKADEAIQLIKLLEILPLLSTLK